MGYQTTSDGTKIVARPEWKFGQIPLTRTDDGSEQINVNGLVSGTPEVVWNGTGGSDTGGDWTRTGLGNEATAAAKSGTNGLNTTLTSAGDTSIFDKGSMIDVAGTYQSLAFWMRPKAFPTGSKLRAFWRDSSDDQVGNPVLVNAYIDNFDLNVWQYVVIPVADFALGGNAQKLVFRYADVAGQRYNFDDIELYPDGGPHRFRAAAPAGYVYHVKEVVLTFSEENGTWTAGDFTGISGGLDKGIVVRHRRLSTNDVFWAFNLRDNISLFGRFRVKNDVEYSSQVHQFTLVLEPDPAVITVTDDDVIEIVVRDNLTSINAMRAFLQYGEEVAA